MTKQEFIDKVMFVPWVNRGLSFDGMDCFGLVYLYHKHVLGVDIGVPHLHKGSGPLDASKWWADHLYRSSWLDIVKTSVDDKTMIMMYNGTKPQHVGMMLDKKHVLHSCGSSMDGGGVKIHKINTIEKNFFNVTFHKNRVLL